MNKLPMIHQRWPRKVVKDPPNYFVREAPYESNQAPGQNPDSKGTKRFPPDRAPLIGKWSSHHGNRISNPIEKSFK